MSSDLMPVPFAVVKFVADPIRDEPVNVGVVCMTKEGVRSRFVESMSRFKGALDSDDLKALPIAVRFLRSSLDRTPDITLEQLHDSLSGQLRVSELMGGLTEDVDSFLDDQFEIYVSSPALVGKARPGEDRKKIKDRIRKAIGGLGRQSEMFALGGKQRVKGELGRYQFDFGIVNGCPTLMSAISFQTQEDYALSEAKLLTFAAMDTKKIHEDVRVAAIVAPPLERTSVYDEALRVLNSQTSIIDSSDGALDEFVGSLLSDSDVKPIPNDWLEPVPQTP